MCADVCTYIIYMCRPSSRRRLKGDKKVLCKGRGLKICVCTVVVIVCLRILLIIKIYGNGSLSGECPWSPLNEVMVCVHIHVCVRVHDMKWLTSV